ncbi:hypothetical protein BD311DRAFT_756203, partial [Dichomitus squalens]
MTLRLLQVLVPPGAAILLSQDVDACGKRQDRKLQLLRNLWFVYVQSEPRPKGFISEYSSTDPLRPLSSATCTMSTPQVCMSARRPRSHYEQVAFKGSEHGRILNENLLLYCQHAYIPL